MPDINLQDVPVWSKDGVTLYQTSADALLASLDDQSAGVLTDPPYGIGYDKQLSRLTRKAREEGKSSSRFRYRDYGDTSWDDQRPDDEIFEELLRVGKEAIVWGGNYFADLLPPSQRWLVWDKGQRDFSLADVELAWTSFDKASRCKTIARSAAFPEGRIHPTQKPLELISWCLSFLDPDLVVVDPFAGSATTAVACLRAGRKFVGCEIFPTYFEKAVVRLEDEWSKPTLPGFGELRPAQEEMFQ